MPTQQRYFSAAQLAVLVALKEHHYLTVDQLMLLTGRTSLRATQQTLTDLSRAGLVHKHTRRSSDVVQPLRAAWSLTGTSKAYLEEGGMVVLPPGRPRPYTLDHLLAVNDVLIRGKLLARELPSTVQLRDLYHDRELRTWDPPLSVVPDGFLDFAITTPAGRDRFPVLLELDMGTMDRRRWQEKVQRYVPFLTSEMHRALGITVASIAVVADDKPERVWHLKRWTEQELARLGQTDLNDLFYFTRLERELSAREFFCCPRFLIAGTANKAALLPA